MEHIIAKLVKDFEEGRITRRHLIQSLALTATVANAAPAEAAPNTVVKATYLNHISYQVADYARTRDFYAGLFGMKVTNDEPARKRCILHIGDSKNILIVRTGPYGKIPPGTPMPQIDHMAFVVANWDEDKKVKGAVEDELKRRGLEARAGTLGGWFTKDPDGFEIQLGGEEQ